MCPYQNQEILAPFFSTVQRPTMKQPVLTFLKKLFLFGAAGKAEIRHLVLKVVKILQRRSHQFITSLNAMRRFGNLRKNLV